MPRSKHSKSLIKAELSKRLSKDMVTVISQYLYHDLIGRHPSTVPKKYKQDADKHKAFMKVFIHTPEEMKELPFSNGIILETLEDEVFDLECLTDERKIIYTIERILKSQAPLVDRRENEFYTQHHICYPCFRYNLHHKLSIAMNFDHNGRDENDMDVWIELLKEDMHWHKLSRLFAIFYKERYNVGKEECATCKIWNVNNRLVFED